MQYHFRKFLDTKPFRRSEEGAILQVEDIESALVVAYSLSDEFSMSFIVCRESGTVDMPAFTEVATVKALR